MKATHPTPPEKGIPRVALLVESSRTYGRGILRGIARYARLHGPWSFYVIERELQSGVPAGIKEWCGDGIIARIESQGMAERLMKAGVPVVDVLGQVKGVPGLDTDASAVAAMAVEFFARAAFRHFAFFGYPGISFSDQRCAAFINELARRGLEASMPPGPRGQRRKIHIQSVERQGIAPAHDLAEWLRGQTFPLALLACNDVCAQQVLNACREHGIRVPEDVSVMGVDNDDVLCNLCDPPLSSIEPDAEGIGFQAAEMLHQMMSGKRMGAGVRKVAPLRLVERTSTDVVAVEDAITVEAVRYIRNCVGEGIAVKDVVRHMGRSRSDLDSRFRKYLQSSVRAEILRRRMERVTSLLMDTQLGLDQIAARSGFATAAHLCRLFQRAHGQTPTEFRRKHCENR